MHSALRLTNKAFALTSTQHKVLIVVALVLAMVSLRLVHLSADTPAGVADGPGLYVDEGYKTLSARNLILFGTERWHPRDDYRGWAHLSPIMHWSYYAAFWLSSPRVENVRIVTIISFAVFLLFYIWGVYQRYRWDILVIGLVLLGLQSTIFFFSRVALIEIPLTTFLYALVFAFARLKQDQTPLPVLLAFGAAIMIATLGIKASALVYILPVAATPVLQYMLQHRSNQNPKMWVYVSLVIIAVAGLLFVTSQVWSPRIDFRPLHTIQRLLGNPLMVDCPVILLFGLFCALHILLCRPDLYCSDRYKLSLLSIITLSPIALAVFKYHPLRYYVPLIPAYTLLILEWIHLKAWSWSPSQHSRWLSPIAIVLLILLAFYSGGAFNAFVLSHIDIGAEPGLGLPTLIRLFGPVSVVLAFLMWRWRYVIFGKRLTLLVFVIASVAFVGGNFYRIGSFLYQPAFEAERVRLEIAHHVRSDATIIGDWAPFLTLGTNVRALYMDRKFNHASRINELSPQYFLYSGSVDDDLSLAVLRHEDNISLGVPTYLGSYNRHTIILYPILYGKQPLRGGGSIVR